MKSVLLIQPDAEERAALAHFLGQAGWQVWETAAEAPAVTLARDHRPTVVVLDLPATRPSSFALCAAIRAEEHLAALRIIAICDPDPSLSRTRALEAGADEFLLKPVAHEELLRLMENLGAGGDVGPAAPNAPSDGQSTTLRFWGVRGSIPAPGPGTLQYGGNTSCIEIRADGEIIVLDSGSGIRLLGHALATEFKVRPLQVTILITHTHWDHIQGFPFFLPAYDRKNHIRILGYEGARAGLTRIFSLQMEGPYFPIDFKELPSHIVIEELKALTFQIGRVKVQAMFANHPGLCMGYRLATSNGTIIYLPDNEPCYLVHPHARKHLGELAAGASPTKAQEQCTLDFIRDAEVLIIDSQYDAKEYKSHMGWGHGCLDDVVRLAIQGGVKRLYLFHHDPDHDDAKVNRMVEAARKLAQAAGSPIVIEAAREGERCNVLTS